MPLVAALISVLNLDQAAVPGRGNQVAECPRATMSWAAAGLRMPARIRRSCGPSGSKGFRCRV